MPLKNIFKTLLNVKHTAIDNISTDGCSLVIDVHPTKSFRHRCGRCGHKGTFYDYGNDKGPRLWRCLDFEGHRVFLRYSTYRVFCPHRRAVHTSRVPWASHGSRFTHRFEEATARFAPQMNKSATSSYVRIAWRSVGEITSRVKDAIAATTGAPLDGLTCIGIDETSYCKGHKYTPSWSTIETGKVVWVHEGRDKATIELFFKELGPERCKKIRLVSCDGARTIRDSIEKYCENAARCVDPFHVVEWSTEALDKVRSEFWHKAQAEEPRVKRGRGRPKRGEEKREPLSQIIKDSKYAVGKAPENLTENQRKKLELIAAKCPTLFRARALKESLRLIFTMEYEQAKAELDKWIGWARRCRIKPFVELQKKIRRHYDAILASIRYGLSNARIEATNNKIKLVIRTAYGFRNTRNTLDTVLLKCGCYKVTLPWEKVKDAA